MKNRIKYIILFFVIISGLMLYLFQSREYYCLSKDRCITVWKTTEGCYIIAGKYKSWFKPNKCNYIKAKNNQLLTLYYSDKSPNIIIVKNQGSEGVPESKYEIINYSENNIFVDYSEKYRAMLYHPNSKSRFNLYYDAYLIDLDIKSNYANDKDGSKL